MTVTFGELWGRWVDCPAHGRSVAFGSLPQRDQDACWDDLAVQCRRSIEAEYLLEQRLYEEWPPPKRRTSRHGTPTSTSTGTGRVQFDHGDALKRIGAKEYVELLCGVAVPPSGKIRCPLPQHDDREPSFKVYGTEWWCFGCNRGRDIYDLAAAVYGLELRGADFIELKRRLLDALLGGVPDA
jgi:hypothetical protein